MILNTTRIHIGLLCSFLLCRYDVDGFFGNTEMAPTDAESVMRNGRSVCEGYARVFELLCRYFLYLTFRIKCYILKQILAVKGMNRTSSKK